MHYFLLGPSGVGKTTFANWLGANRDYLHIPIDLGDQGNGLIAEGLVDVAIQLLQGDPAPFASELDKRAKAAGKTGRVLDFWSVLFVDREGITKLAEDGIALRPNVCGLEFQLRFRGVGDAPRS